MFVCALVLLNKACPLTILENLLYASPGGRDAYDGSFLLFYIEGAVYPDIDPFFITTGTILITVITLFIYIFRPPIKIRRLFMRHAN